MKRTLLMLAVLCSFIATSFAATYTISVANYAFTPATITGVHPGDTITWVWVSGTHTTTNGMIPSTAGGWDSPISPTVPSFSYVVPSEAGVYNYKCTPHESMGMVGSFTVEFPSGVPGIAPLQFSMYPNPASNTVTLQFAQQAAVTITIADLAGRTVKQVQGAGASMSVDIAQLTTGIYFVTAAQNGAVSRKELVIR